MSGTFSLIVLLKQNQTAFILNNFHFVSATYRIPALNKAFSRHFQTIPTSRSITPQRKEGIWEKYSGRTKCQKKGNQPPWRFKERGHFAWEVLENPCGGGCAWGGQWRRNWFGWMLQNQERELFSHNFPPLPLPPIPSPPFSTFCRRLRNHRKLCSQDSSLWSSTLGFSL